MRPGYRRRSRTMILISFHHVHGRLGPPGAANDPHEQRQQAHPTRHCMTRLNQAYSP